MERAKRMLCGYCASEQVRGGGGGGGAQRPAALVP